MKQMESAEAICLFVITHNCSSLERDTLNVEQTVWPPFKEIAAVSVHAEMET